MADLALLRPLLGKGGEWVVDLLVIFLCFVTISKFGRFKNPLQTITVLSKNNFRHKKIVLVVQAKKSDFYEQWQQHKHVEAMEMNYIWPESLDEWYIDQLKPESLKELSYSTRSSHIKYILSYNNCSVIATTIPNQSAQE